MPSAVESRMRALASAARDASRALVRTPTHQKDAALAAMAKALRRRAAQVLRENRLDLRDAKKAGLSPAMLDRLLLDRPRVEAMARAIEEVRALPDPVGEVTEVYTRPNGLRVERVRIPLGVILMIYESRPNVTADAAALCLKSGNAPILRGGKEALRSNRAIAAALAEGATSAGLPEAAVQLVDTPDREALASLLTFDDLIDLCIPRGGEALIRAVAQGARMPVVRHYKGVCHVYVHRAADPEKAQAITVNAKAQRPGVCNAAECLLVDRAVAAEMLPRLGRALAKARVELRCDPTALSLLSRARVPAVAAEPEDFGREFLDRIMAIRVVRDLDGALQHIERYGSQHTEAIVTQDWTAARRFAAEVTASAVMINASTRFNDGGELGLGAEIGISTSKVHAFGPMGLRELTSRKFVVQGDGQVRGSPKRPPARGRRAH